jgi:hypothetical protein
MKTKEQQFVEAMRDYANRSHSYLEGRTDYGRGYRDAVAQVKATIIEMLEYFDLNNANE